MRLLLATCLLAGLARGAAAEGWELTVTAGKVFPLYNQTFEYDPGTLAPPIPGATLEQRGVFTLDARGALALNLALARDLAPHVAIEGRLDTADVTVDTIGARYRLRVNLPAPLPPLSTDVDLGTGNVDLEALAADVAEPEGAHGRPRPAGRIGRRELAAEARVRGEPDDRGQPVRARTEHLARRGPGGAAGASAAQRERPGTLGRQRRAGPRGARRPRRVRRRRTLLPLPEADAAVGTAGDDAACCPPSRRTW